RRASRIRSQIQPSVHETYGQLTVAGDDPAITRDPAGKAKVFLAHAKCRRCISGRHASARCRKFLVSAYGEQRDCGVEAPVHVEAWSSRRVVWTVVPYCRSAVHFWDGFASGQSAALQPP